jgi:hypothetical protein
MGSLEKKLPKFSINPFGFRSQRKSGRLFFNAGDGFLECQPPSACSFGGTLTEPIVDLMNVEFCARKNSDFVWHA